MKWYQDFITSIRKWLKVLQLMQPPYCWSVVSVAARTDAYHNYNGQAAAASHNCNNQARVRLLQERMHATTATIKHGSGCCLSGCITQLHQSCCCCVPQLQQSSKAQAAVWADACHNCNGQAAATCRNCNGQASTLLLLCSNSLDGLLLKVLDDRHTG